MYIDKLRSLCRAKDVRSNKSFTPNVCFRLLTAFVWLLMHRIAILRTHSVNCIVKQYLLRSLDDTEVATATNDSISLKDKSIRFCQRGAMKKCPLIPLDICAVCWFILPSSPHTGLTCKSAQSSLGIATLFSSREVHSMKYRNSAMECLVHNCRNWNLDQGT